MGCAASLGRAASLSAPSWRAPQLVHTSPNRLDSTIFTRVIKKKYVGPLTCSGRCQVPTRSANAGQRRALLARVRRVEAASLEHSGATVGVDAVGVHAGCAFCIWHAWQPDTHVLWIHAPPQRVGFLPARRQQVLVGSAFAIERWWCQKTPGTEVRGLLGCRGFCRAVYTRPYGWTRGWCGGHSQRGTGGGGLAAKAV